MRAAPAARICFGVTADTITQEVDAIAEDLALFDDWEERYSYIIDTGRALPDLPAAERTEDTKVRGCVSQVWLVSEKGDGGKLIFRGDSDAHIVRGLVALLLRVYSNRTPQEIISMDAKTIAERLHLQDALTPQRSNGLNSMLARIRADAEAALASS